ncbi:MAG TPA: sporulation protein [Symbiobacteriaceae bacterium]|nr:sporulation protein [Symbiobacteriaceae bacterium]
MSFLNRMMASVGIGSARIDTRLNNAQVRAGEDLEGVVVVHGGSLDQQVDSLSLHLVTLYNREVNDRRVRESFTLAKARISDGFSLQAGETCHFPFRFPLPDSTPVTAGSTRVWLKTGADIPLAVDPSDTDELFVLPHRHSQVILDAVESLGFRLRQADCEFTHRLGRHFPFVQEFEFVPTAGRYRGRLDELEVVLWPHGRGVDALLEIDRRARGFGGFLEAAFDADESRVMVEFGPEHMAAGPADAARHLNDLLARYTR